MGICAGNGHTHNDLVQLAEVRARNSCRSLMIALLPRAYSFGPWSSGFSLLTTNLTISSRFSALFYDDSQIKSEQTG